MNAAGNLIASERCWGELALHCLGELIFLYPESAFYSDVILAYKGGLRKVEYSRIVSINTKK